MVASPSSCRPKNLKNSVNSRCLNKCKMRLQNEISLKFILIISLLDIKDCLEMGNSNDKPVSCEQGRHTVGMLQCQNSGCEESICKKCWRELEDLKVCMDCKTIMTLFQKGRDPSEVKRIGTMVERGQVTYEDKLAAEEVLA